MSNEEQPSENSDSEERLKGQAPEIKEESLIIYQFNDEEGEFEELEIEEEEGDEEEFKLYDLLDSENILLIVDPAHYRVWVWHGLNTTTRMKFISAKIAPSVRDLHGIAYKITTVDDGNETQAFRIMIGLEEEINYEEEQTGPAYEGTKEDLRLLESLSREKIILLLEKSGVPEGYERKMILVKNKLYGYKEYDTVYIDTVIKEKRLFPLKEQVEDGMYLAEGYVPRMLFSFNNVVLTEFLKKVEDKNN